MWKIEREHGQSQIQGQQGGGAPLSHPELEKEVRINKTLTYNGQQLLEFINLRGSND